MSFVPFRHLLGSLIVASLVSMQSFAQTTRSDGDLFQLDVQTNQFFPLHQKCSVEIGPATTMLDTEHGSPRQIFKFPYALSGFPKDVQDYSEGVAVGSAYTVRSAQASFEPGIFAGFIGDIVYVNFEFTPSTYEEFVVQPRIENIRAIYTNPTKGYFGFSDVKWTYDCRFTQGN